MRAVVVGGGHGCGYAGLVEEVGCRRCGGPLTREGLRAWCADPGCVYPRPVFLPKVELSGWIKDPDTHWMFDGTGRPLHDPPQPGCWYCYPPDEPEPMLDHPLF